MPWLSLALGLALAAALGFILIGRPSKSGPGGAAGDTISDLPRIPIPIEEPGPAGPVFSPDGKSILYTALAGETSQVFLRQLDSPDSQQLTTQTQDVQQQSLSRSSARVVLPKSCGRSGAYTLTPDGRAVVSIPDAFAQPGATVQISHPIGSALRPLRNSPALKAVSGMNFRELRFPRPEATSDCCRQCPRQCLPVGGALARRREPGARNSAARSARRAPPF